MVQIVEDVGMYFWMLSHGVLIWNWVTGEKLVVRLIVLYFIYLHCVHTLMRHVLYVDSR